MVACHMFLVWVEQMARPLRVDIEGGWNHVTARGTERRSIFPDAAYNLHLLHLLEGMSERYGVEFLDAMSTVET